VSKDTKIISDLRSFFAKNDDNRAIKCIMGVMEHINIRSSQISSSFNKRFAGFSPKVRGFFNRWYNKGIEYLNNPQRAVSTANTVSKKVKITIRNSNRQKVYRHVSYHVYIPLLKFNNIVMNKIIKILSSIICFFCFVIHN